MADMDVETEIRDLKRRVGELEGSFGFLTQQVRGVHRDLIGFQEETRTRFDRLETDVAILKTDVAELKTDVAILKIDVAGLKTDLKQLREDLPSIVGDVMREVLRETRR